MQTHVYLASAKGDTFGFQSQALFDGGIPAKLDFTSGAEHALPGQAKRSAQNLSDLPRRTGEARSPSNRSVG